MILVCVGASEYSFDRLLKIIDDLCDDNIIDKNDVIAQIGCSEYTPHNFTCFSLIDRLDFQRYMREAELIITHAGTGSVVPPLKIGKKVIVFPRRAQFGEHLDDHQTELAELFTSMGYTMRADDKESLRDAILSVNEFIPTKFISGNARIQQIIADFIEGRLTE